MVSAESHIYMFIEQHSWWGCIAVLASSPNVHGSLPPPPLFFFLGSAVISNDGATILKTLDIVHPAAKTLVDIAKSQDAEVTYQICFNKNGDLKN